MNIAVVLAGGVGNRMGADIPKQYIEAAGKPILFYCLELFQQLSPIDSVVVVASKEWHQFIRDWLAELSINKVQAIIEGGKSRQHSVLNGLRYIHETMDTSDVNILIHDAARPGVTPAIICSLLDAAKEAEAAVPVIPVKDTMYFSPNCDNISGLVDRSQIFSAQSPEVFHFDTYYNITCNMTDDELLSIRGCSESAFLNGITVKLVPGDEKNYKITTMSDLERFLSELAP